MRLRDTNPNFSFDERRYAAGRRQPTHTDIVTRLSLVLSGRLEETHKKRVHRPAALSLVVKPGDEPHANVFGEGGARLFSIVPPASLDASALRYRWIDSGPHARTALVVRTLARAGRVAEAQRLASDLFGDLAGHPAPEAETPCWWPDALELLRASARRGDTVDSVAARIGVHPAHLNKLCKRHLGCPTAGYLRRRRAQAAARLLGSARETPMAQVAARSGFHDQAHLCRVFRAEFGVTPGEHRAQLRRG